MDTIFFYVPDEKLIKLFDQTIEECKICDNFTCWILATYIFLKKVGFSCEITTKIPKKGILLADRDSLNQTYIDFANVMLICAKGDRDFHPSAELHIVQNPTELQDYKNSIWNPYYIPLWPQTKLIPRLKERGTRVENIAYMGSKSQLCQELQDQKWADTLKSLGYQWMPLFSPNQWHDYSNIDVIIAVRNFKDNNSYKYKPASKLINCWRAGVPAVLPNESAYMAERNSDLDFLMVDSVESTINTLEKLKNNSNLYQSMVENGFNHVQRFSFDNLTNQWLYFFEQFVIPYYQEWSKISYEKRKMSFMKRYIYFKTYALQKRFWKSASIAK